MRGVLLSAICGLLLTGCASIRSTMISSDTALISVVGQNENDRARVVNTAVAEAARVTREHGFRYFVILEAANASQSGARVQQGETIPNTITTVRSFGNANLNTIHLGGATYTTPDRKVTYVRAGLDVTIRMYHEGEVDPRKQGVWNSAIIPRGAATAP
jgi:hypothetical protein